MKDPVGEFGGIAKGLARNPLGIIALFIVLVYGFASVVTVSARTFSSSERLPLIYFMVGFPVLVLAVFAWLVSQHTSSVYSPGDFKNEENWVKMQMSAVASLAVASAKSDTPASPSELERIVNSVRSTSPRATTSLDSWRNHVLWVDDRPNNNTFERQAFEAVGLQFTLALSTNEALNVLAKEKFAAIISDMGRREGPREGYVLLDQLRKDGNRTPLFFYAASNAPEHKQETIEHGGQGCTNNAQELFQMVTRAVISNMAG
jgi:CheY-like chemotaxis protein